MAKEVGRSVQEDSDTRMQEELEAGRDQIYSLAKEAPLGSPMLLAIKDYRKVYKIKSEIDELTQDLRELMRYRDSSDTNLVLFKIRLQSAFDTKSKREDKVDDRKVTIGGYDTAYDIVNARVKAMEHVYAKHDRKKSLATADIHGYLHATQKMAVRLSIKT